MIFNYNWEEGVDFLFDEKKKNTETKKKTRFWLYPWFG